jgi:hypothetical protein
MFNKIDIQHSIGHETELPQRELAVGEHATRITGDEGNRLARLVPITRLDKRKHRGERLVGGESPIGARTIIPPQHQRAHTTRRRGVWFPAARTRRAPRGGRDASLLQVLRRPWRPLPAQLQLLYHDRAARQTRIPIPVAREFDAIPKLRQRVRRRGVAACGRCGGLDRSVTCRRRPSCATIVPVALALRRRAGGCALRRQHFCTSDCRLRA